MKITLAMVSLLSLLAFTAQAADTPNKAKKQTTLGLYLTASEVHKKLSTSKKVFFVDIRTRAEVNFLGMPSQADANIPYMIMPDFYAWNKKKASFKLKPNNDFSNALAARLKAKGLDKSAEIILMCRSGSRSAKAVNLLSKLGYKKVYTVVDGYEGGKAKKGPTKGQRTVNGWKNSKLPWTYKLDPKKMYNISMK